jgi:hypothetical protein
MDIVKCQAPADLPVTSSRGAHGLVWMFLYQMRLAETLHSRRTSGVAAPAADWVLAQRPRLGTILIVVLLHIFSHDRHGGDY